MKLRMIPMAAVAAAALIGAQASAQADYSTWGVKAGLFMPTSSELRSIFGDNWFSVGLTPQQKVTNDKLVFGGDIGLITASSGGNRLLLIPVTVGYTMLFAPRQNTVVPYGAARIGAAYEDYSITRPSLVNYSKSIINPTGNVEVGVIFSQKFVLAARYDWFAESDNFSFDGFTIWAELQLFKF